MKSIFLFLLIALPLSGTAQNGEKEVIATVRQFFKGLRDGDSQLTAESLHRDLRMISVVVNSKNETRIVEENRDTLLLLVGTPHNEIWDERISGIHVRMDGRLAVLSCDYEFYVGDQYSHKGIDIFELVMIDDKWQIISITDTRRK